MRTSKIGAAHAGPRRTRSRTRIAAGALTVVSVAGLTTGMMVNSANGAPAFVPNPPVYAAAVGSTTNLTGTFAPVTGLTLNLTKRGLYLVNANLRGKLTSTSGAHDCWVVGDIAMNGTPIAHSRRLVAINLGSSTSAVDVQATAPISMIVDVPKGGATVVARAQTAGPCTGLVVGQILNDGNGESSVNAVKLSK